ncbi:MAG: ferrous iron transport protein A [Verrucomicrobia bacterium]|nr:ferrous iron transport protein A [Verrucomicrobiota bacterium]MCH8514348.1 ferrous iron transport protein A [Kiritimatiellia bacterium]
MDKIAFDDQQIPLTRLPAKACGIVTNVENKEELERLQAMGLCLGRRLEVVKTGDPLIVRVFGSRIGLSYRLAKHIGVSPCPIAPRCWEKEP